MLSNAVLFQSGVTVVPSIERPVLVSASEAEKWTLCVEIRISPS